MRVTITARRRPRTCCRPGPRLLRVRRTAATDPGRGPDPLGRVPGSPAGISASLPETVDSATGARSAWVAYPALEAGGGGESEALHPARPGPAAHRSGVAALLCRSLRQGAEVPEAQPGPCPRSFTRQRAISAGPGAGSGAWSTASCRISSPRTIRSPQGFEELAAAGAPTDPAGRPRAALCGDPRAQAYAAVRGEIAALSGGRGRWPDFGRPGRRPGAPGPADHFIALYDRPPPIRISCVTSRRSPSGQADGRRGTSKRTGSRRPGSRRPSPSRLNRAAENAAFPDTSEQKAPGARGSFLDDRGVQGVDLRPGTRHRHAGQPEAAGGKDRRGRANGMRRRKAEGGRGKVEGSWKVEGR